MSYAKRYTVPVATDGDGDAEVYAGPFTGRLVNIIYTKTDYAAGVDFAITAESSGLTLWTENDVNASKAVSPRQATHTTVGVENDTAGDVLLGDIYLAQDRVKIVIAQGGATKTGTFDIIVVGPSG